MRTRAEAANPSGSPCRSVHFCPHNVCKRCWRPLEGQAPCKEAALSSIISWWHAYTLEQAPLWLATAPEK